MARDPDDGYSAMYSRGLGSIGLYEARRSRRRPILSPVSLERPRNRMILSWRPWMNLDRGRNRMISSWQRWMLHDLDVAGKVMDAPRLGCSLNRMILSWATVPRQQYFQAVLNQKYASCHADHVRREGRNDEKRTFTCR